MILALAGNFPSILKNFALPNLGSSRGVGSVCGEPRVCSKEMWGLTGTFVRSKLGLTTSFSCEVTSLMEHPTPPQAPVQRRPGLSGRRRSAYRFAHRATCPHCRSPRVQAHGFFTRRDGSRQPRQLCRACNRTFNQHTGTPLHYIKKRTEWRLMTSKMSRWMPVRRMAAAVRVTVATAFRWRHRLMRAVSPQPNPVLTGTVVAGEAYVPYSEKGRRQPGGPGSRGARPARAIVAVTGPTRFRRIRDGKPSFVLLACAGPQQAVVLAGQGRPSPQELQTTLRQLLGPGALVQASGLAPYAQACHLLAMPCVEATLSGCQVVDRLRRRFYSWLRPMHGVATRYLLHYVTWFTLAGRVIYLPLPVPPAA